MNTFRFDRGPQRLNPLLRLVQNSQKPFFRFRREIRVEDPTKPAPGDAITLTAPVRLSPGTYRPRDENTTFTDRQSALRFLVSRSLGVSFDQLNTGTVLNGAGFGRQALLDLVAAIDLEFGVYVEPEIFNAEFSFAKLSHRVFTTEQMGSPDHEK